MNIEELRNYCLSFAETTEEFPFDEKTLVFKVFNKMFLLTNIDDFNSINIKCDPELALERRETHPEVTPGYHMNKKHWNTVKTNQNIGDETLKKWINESYNLVVKTLPKKTQQKVKNRNCE